MLPWTGTVSAADTVAELRSKVENLERRLADVERHLQHDGTQPPTTNPDEGGYQSTEGGPLPSGAVQFYGQLRVSVDGKGGDFAGTGVSLVSNAPRLGVRGTLQTPLADISVIYQAEVQYETTDRVAKDFEFREGFVGLEGG